MKNELLNFKISRVFYLAVFLMLIITLPSVAQAADIFTPNEGDISLNILSQMFGDLVTYASSSSTNPYVGGHNIWLGSGLDPFQTVLRIFNTVCMSVGALLAVYTLVMSLINTAHEGQLFGKELGNPAIWLRMGVGVAMILPVFKGYCLLQVIIMWIIIQSIGAADSTWKMWFGVQDGEIGAGWAEGSDASSGNMKDLYSLKMPSADSASFVYKVFEGYTCLYGVTSQRLISDLNNDSAAALNSEVTSSNQNNDVTQMKQDNAGNISSSFTQPDGTTKITTVSSGVDSEQTLITNNQDKNIKSAEDNNTKQSQIFETNKQKHITLDNLKNVGGTLYGANAAHNTTNPIFQFGGAANGGQYNIQPSDACGWINFNETNNNGDSGNTAALKSLQSSKNSISDVISTDKNIEGMENFTGKGIDSKNDFIKKLREKRNSTNDTQLVLKAYSELFNEYQEKIRDLSAQYVNELNTDVIVTYANTTANGVVDDKKNTYRYKYIKELDELANEFEQKLIVVVYKAYRKSQDDLNSSLSSKHNSGSIENLTTESSKLGGNYVDFISTARENAKSDGWITAGMWYMSITNSISKLHDLMNISPAYNKSLDGNKVNDLVGNLNNSATTNNVLNTIQNNYGLFSDFAEYSSFKSVRMRAKPVVDTSNAIGALAMGVDLENLTDMGRHPVIILTESGHNLIDSAEKYMMYSSYWQSQKSAHNNKENQIRQQKGRAMQPDPNNPLSQANTMLSYFVGAIMVMGFMMAYYIPVLPFLIWIGAALGWLISVIEAIFIAPLWGAMHLHPNGDKYTGKGAVGYSFLLSVALKPTLMILGFIASIVIIPVFGTFVNYIFAIAISFSLDNSGASNNVTMSRLMYTLSMYGIYAIFMSGLITKMFNVITIIPDNILKWIGGQAGNLSEYGAIGGNETYGKLNGLASSGGSAYAQRVKAHGEMAGNHDVTNKTDKGLNAISSTDMNSAMATSNGTTGFNPGSAGMSSNMPAAAIGGASLGTATAMSSSNVGSNNMAANGGDSSRPVPSDDNLLKNSASRNAGTSNSTPYDLSNGSDSASTSNGASLNSYGGDINNGDRIPYNASTGGVGSIPSKSEAIARNQLYDNAQSLFSDAGFSNADSHKYAAMVADNGYSSNHAQNAFNNWNAKEVGSRLQTEEGQAALMAAVQPNQDGKEMTKNFADVVKGVSNSRGAITNDSPSFSSSGVASSNLFSGQSSGYSASVASQNDGFSSSVGAQNSGYASSAAAQNEGFAASSATQNSGYASSAASQNESFAASSAAQNQSFASSAASQNESFVASSAAQNSGYASSSAAQNQSFASNAAAQNESYTASVAAQNSGYASSSAAQNQSFASNAAAQTESFTANASSQNESYAASAAAQNSSAAPMQNNNFASNAPLNDFVNNDNKNA